MKQELLQKSYYKKVVSYEDLDYFFATNIKSSKELNPQKLRFGHIVTVDEADLALTAFAAKWDKEFPSISKSWREKWYRLTPFFAYPADIRKAIYTTNAIESINMSLRKVIKNKRVFPSDDAALKQLYLALKNISKKWTMPIHNWKAALNCFAIMFSDRIEQH